MTAVGTPKEHASALADVLLEADRRGHYSHGLNRLGKERESVMNTSNRHQHMTSQGLYFKLFSL